MQTVAHQLSQWIENTHPDLFDAIFGHIQTHASAASTRRARLRGFADDLDDILADTAVQNIDFSSSNAGSDLFDFSPSADFSPSVDFADRFNLPDSGSVVSQFSPPSVDIPTLSVRDLTGAVGGGGTSTAINSSGSGAVNTDTGGSGFFDSIGSGIANAASSVGNFLTSPAGLSTLEKIGTAYFQLQNNKVNADVQRQVLQAQIARVANGQSPAPLTYGVAPNGQVVPIYQSSPLLRTSTGAIVSPSNMPTDLVAAIQAGQAQLVTMPDGSTGYTLPPSVVASISGNFPSWVPWAAGLFVLLLLKRRS